MEIRDEVHSVPAPFRTLRPWREFVCWSMSGDLTLFILRAQQMSDSNGPGCEVKWESAPKKTKVTPTSSPRLTTSRHETWIQQSSTQLFVIMVFPSGVYRPDPDFPRSKRKAREHADGTRDKRFSTLCTHHCWSRSCKEAGFGVISRNESSMSQETQTVWLCGADVSEPLTTDISSEKL